MNTNRHPKIGLILGGGGARGLAHIGVLKVFASQGIPIDILAGTSMGGLVAAAYAAGLSTLEMEAEAVRMTHIDQMMRLVDLSSPRRGLIEGSHMRAYLGGLLGKDTTFENLSIPLALPAIDLATGRQIVQRKGLLADAVLATIAVPGLITPVCVDGYELVDGGILNNVPVDVAIGMGADITIAVDVSPAVVRDASVPYQPGEEKWPGWFPHFARDFYRAELLMVSALTEIHLREARPDVLIRPGFPAGISIFWGFTRAAEAIQAGELAALQALPDIRELLDSQ